MYLKERCEEEGEEKERASNKWEGKGGKVRNNAIEEEGGWK